VPNPTNPPAFTVGESIFFKGDAVTPSQIATLGGIDVSINLNGTPAYIYSFTNFDGEIVTVQETDLRHAIPYVP